MLSNDTSFNFEIQNVQSTSGFSMSEKSIDHPLCRDIKMQQFTKSTTIKGHDSRNCEYTMEKLF